MLHRVLTAMALVCVMAGTVDARPLSARLFSTKADASQPSGAKAGRALSIARQYIGTNPTGTKRLWCQRFANLVLKKMGMKGTGSDAAISMTKAFPRVSVRNARPGDFAVTRRKGGHHVGVIESVNGKTVTMISGNSGGRGPGRRVVARGQYAISKLVAVVRPS